MWSCGSMEVRPILKLNKTQSISLNLYLSLRRKLSKNKNTPWQGLMHIATYIQNDALFRYDLVIIWYRTWLRKLWMCIRYLLQTFILEYVHNVDCEQNIWSYTYRRNMELETFIGILYIMHIVQDVFLINKTHESAFLLREGIRYALHENRMVFSSRNHTPVKVMNI